MNLLPPLSSADAASQALLELGQWLRQRRYHFITPTPATHARVNGRPGNEVAASLEDVLGWSRPFRPDVLDPTVLALMQRANIVQPAGAHLRCTLRASTLGSCLYFHSAFPTEASDAVFFGPDTYRFAAAIQQALEVRDIPVATAVDLGCGAGPGALSIAGQHPQATVHAVDINPGALRLTEINARVNGMSNVVACRSDLLTEVSGDFDFIVANPPYLVDPGERTYRHGGGPLGADLSLRIVETGLKRLAPGGTLLLYTGAAIVAGRDPFWQGIEPMLAASDVYWDYREIDPDVFGEELDTPVYTAADRIAAVVLVATRRIG